CRRDARLLAQPTKPPCPTSAVPHRVGRECLEINNPWVSSNANTHVRLRAVLDSAECPDRVRLYLVGYGRPSVCCRCRSPSAVRVLSDAPPSRKAPSISCDA